MKTYSPGDPTHVLDDFSQHLREKPESHLLLEFPQRSLLFKQRLLPRPLQRSLPTPVVYIYKTCQFKISKDSRKHSPRAIRPSVRAPRAPRMETATI